MQTVLNYSELMLVLLVLVRVFHCHPGLLAGTGSSTAAFVANPGGTTSRVLGLETGLHVGCSGLPEHEARLCLGEFFQLVFRKTFFLLMFINIH